MAYTFKNMGSVELLEQMPENANVMIEVDGATKRAPQKNVMAELTAAETLEEVPEGATVLAEVGGEIKRVPGEGLGAAGALIDMPDVVVLSVVAGSLVCNKTFSEIIDLIMNNGLHLIVVAGLGNGYMTLPIQSCVPYDSNGEVIFTSGNDASYIAFIESALLNVTMYMLSDNTITDEAPSAGPS